MQQMESTFSQFEQIIFDNVIKIICDVKKNEDVNTSNESEISQESQTKIASVSFANIIPEFSFEKVSADAGKQLTDLIRSKFLGNSIQVLDLRRILPEWFEGDFESEYKEAFLSVQKAILEGVAETPIEILMLDEHLEVLNPNDFSADFTGLKYLNTLCLEAYELLIGSEFEAEQIKALLNIFNAQILDLTGTGLEDDEIFLDEEIDLLIEGVKGTSIQHVKFDKNCVEEEKIEPLKEILLHNGFAQGGIYSLRYLCIFAFLKTQDRLIPDSIPIEVRESINILDLRMKTLLHEIVPKIKSDSSEEEMDELDKPNELGLSRMPSLNVEENTLVQKKDLHRISTSTRPNNYDLNIDKKTTNRQIHNQLLSLGLFANEAVRKQSYQDACELPRNQYRAMHVR
jgi:hypothetical protein